DSSAGECCSIEERYCTVRSRDGLSSRNFTQMYCLSDAKRIQTVIRQKITGLAYLTSEEVFWLTNHRRTNCELRSQS
ncbi:hypothetical protein, partial [Rhodohalobacter sp.]|uniref:hypothetical protein n=1 Tax=Rhodohalobacter sp. TaxID=1974210 RepID=UPI00356759A3